MWEGAVGRGRTHITAAAAHLAAMPARWWSRWRRASDSRTERAGGGVPRVPGRRTIAGCRPAAPAGPAPSVPLSWSRCSTGAPVHGRLTAGLRGSHPPPPRACGGSSSRGPAIVASACASSDIGTRSCSRRGGAGRAGSNRTSGVACSSGVRRGQWWRTVSGSVVHRSRRVARVWRSMSRERTCGKWLRSWSRMANPWVSRSPQWWSAQRLSQVAPASADQP